MRIVHTSDWHAGRVWKQQVDRLPELEAVLDDLAAYIEREAIDLVLMTGDVFDAGAPPARAEAVVYRFFKRIGRSGAQSVVIAGNHDSGTRLEAWGELAELVGVHAVGRPRHPSDGGVIELVTRAGETAIIGAVPFAAPRTLVSALQLAADDTVAMQTYADRMRMIAALCSSRFRTDAVNLLCLHTHLDGAVFAGSERRVHLGDDWAAAPQAIPDTAQYVALGHIHKPQSVTAPSPTEYAGSPLQLDFGEAGEAKSFVRIDVAPGRPAQIRRVPYRGARELAVARGTLDELAARRDELAAAGWLKVIAQLSAPEPDLSRKVRALFDNVVAVDFECPSQEREGEAGPTEMRRQGPRRPPPRPPGPPMPVTTAPGRPTRLRVEPTPRMICGPPSRRATRVRCACGSSPPFRPSQCRQLSTRQRARNATRIAIGNAVPARREARAAPSSSPSARSRRRPPGGRRWRPSWAASQPRSRHSRGASRSSSAIS